MNNEEKIKDNEYRILRLSLAFENYEDNGRDTSMPLFDEIINNVNDYRKTRMSNSIENRIELSNKILDKYNELLDIVGRDNFIFYDYGNVDYIWKKD